MKIFFHPKMEMRMNVTKQTFTTLCYVEKEGKYLMLHRTKKEHDINKDKYIGIGGQIEHGETPTECIKRVSKQNRRKISPSAVFLRLNQLKFCRSSHWSSSWPFAPDAMRQGKLHQGWQPCIEQLEPYAKVLERRDRCHCRALP